MGQTLRKRIGDVAGLEPGEYVTGSEYLVGVAVLCCPKCGGLDTLNLDVTIAADGKVLSEWLCPTVTCGAAEWLTLESWGA